MFAYVTRWMRDMRIDGIRMDSVENVANWDFIRDFKDRARRPLERALGGARLGAGADERFLVVGEELTQPMNLLTQGRPWTGFGTTSFRALIRAALIGQSEDGLSFEETVRTATRLPQAFLYRWRAGD